MENLLSKSEMEAVIGGDHGNVFAVLGIHKDKGSKNIFIRAFLPHARSVEVLKKDDGSSLGKMAMFFIAPRVSQNVSRINFTSLSSINSITSDSEKNIKNLLLIFQPVRKYNGKFSTAFADCHRAG